MRLKTGDLRREVGMGWLKPPVSSLQSDEVRGESLREKQVRL